MLLVHTGSRCSSSGFECWVTFRGPIGCTRRPYQKASDNNNLIQSVVCVRDLRCDHCVDGVLGSAFGDPAARRPGHNRAQPTGPHNNNLNVRPCVHCLRGGCPPGRSICPQVSPQKPQNFPRGAVRRVILRAVQSVRKCPPGSPKIFLVALCAALSCGPAHLYQRERTVCLLCRSRVYC